MEDGRAPLNKDKTPRYKAVGVVLAFTVTVVLALIWCQFRGYFRTSTELYVLASRAGLSLDPGSKVTYNGVPIGRLWALDAVSQDILPMPYLVMDTGASIAPYNHIGVNSPLVVDYVWGRQVGEHTINP